MELVDWRGQWRSGRFGSLVKCVFAEVVCGHLRIVCVLKKICHNNQVGGECSCFKRCEFGWYCDVVFGVVCLKC